MHELAIEARGLTKRFGKLVALDDLDLAVERGASLAILGPAGSGKSVALRLFAGLSRPSRGNVSVLGLDPGGRAGLRARRRLGYAGQEPAFYEWMTGRELLAFAAQLLGIQRRDASDTVAQELERVGLADFADRRIADYSLALRQRLGIAQALLGAPDVLLLDEPLAALDAAAHDDVRSLVRGVQGATRLVGTADAAVAEAVAERVAVLDAGRLVASGPTNEVLARGGPSDYVIETAPGAGLALAGLLARLASEAWVRSAVASEGSLRVAIHDETRAEHELLPAVVATGLTVLSLRRERPGVGVLLERIREQPS